jgi:hypothetical protein
LDWVKSKFILAVFVCLALSLLLGCRSDFEQKIKDGNYEQGAWTTNDMESKTIKEKLDAENIDYLFEKKLGKDYFYVKEKDIDKLNKLLGFARAESKLLVVGKQINNKSHQILVANKGITKSEVMNMNYDEALLYVREHGGAYYSVTEDMFDGIEVGSQVKITFNPLEKNTDYSPLLYKAESIQSIEE